MIRPTSFTALVLDQDGDAMTTSIRTLDDSLLPDFEVTVEVAYSSINYKDGMILNGQGRMVKTYPHVPGCDFSGTVAASESPDFAPGDKVILSGWRVGEIHWGGYATRARVRSEWLVALPDGMTLEQASAHGTAGFTAMISLMALEEHGLTPGNQGEVLVTGAAGGVGSIAVALLAANGYRVAASTGRPETHDYLRSLGARTIVERAELEGEAKDLMATQRWAGAIDNVGGTTLGNVLASLYYWGSCAAVGLAAGPHFTSSLIPFLIRGVNLLGIDSNTCPIERRRIAWRRLARELPAEALEGITSVVPLAEVAGVGGKILHGQVRGRTVVDVNA